MREGRGEAREDDEATVEEMPEDLVCKFPRCISVGSWRDPWRINGPARMKGRGGSAENPFSLFLYRAFTASESSLFLFRFGRANSKFFSLSFRFLHLLLLLFFLSLSLPFSRSFPNGRLRSSRQIREAIAFIRERASVFRPRKREEIETSLGNPPSSPSLFFSHRSQHPNTHGEKIHSAECVSMPLLPLCQCRVGGNENNLRVAIRSRLACKTCARSSSNPPARKRPKCRHAIHTWKSENSGLRERNEAGIVKCEENYLPGDFCARGATRVRYTISFERRATLRESRTEMNLSRGMAAPCADVIVTAEGSNRLVVVVASREHERSSLFTAVNSGIRKAARNPVCVFLLKTSIKFRLTRLREYRRVFISRTSLCFSASNVTRVLCRSERHSLLAET